MILDRLQRVTLWLGVLSLPLFPFLALGVRWQWWGFQTAFALLAGLAISVIILLAMAGVGLLLSLRRSDRVRINRGILTVVILATPIAYLTFYGVKASQLPVIHDISTDTSNPPALVALADLRPENANELRYDAETARLQREAYAHIEPLSLPLPPTKSMDVVMRAAAELGWNIVDSDEAAGRLEATDRTFWFGFTDDIVVRLTPEEGGTLIDVRSVSRVGKSDLGKNAERIEAFLEQLKRLK